MELKTKLSLEKIQDSDNITDLLSDDDLKAIGRSVKESFDVDEQSRRKWKKRMESATELALQITQEKTYPWPNAANVKFPLLTIAALQFASRAYPALVKAPDLVKFRVQGRDEGGQKAARAGRISAHMSYQLLEQDESWEEDQDKAFLALPILGCVFKKSYYDPVLGHNVSKLVLPKSLSVHYYAKSIEDAARKTEIFELYKNEIRERELRGIFKEYDYGPPETPKEKEADTRQGTSAPLADKDTPRTFLEQHCFLDLDGDKYKEPYIVTVDEATQKVARIVARIGEVVTEQSVKIEELQKRTKALAEGVQELVQGQEPSQEELAQIKQTEMTLMAWQQQIAELAEEKPIVLKIHPIEHYTKYSFIPSPDGGFYDLGFGALLGPINDSVNTILNQLIDAGSLANSSSGWIGKGARIKGGKQRFQIGEWKRVNCTGQNLRDAIVPLPVNPPSPVLFDLLSLLISYAERIGSVNDAMMGDNPGQNTPAYTSKQMLEQGLQVFNGIFKRVYRSFRGELRKLYNLNGKYLDQEEYFSYQDSDTKALQVDYTADAKDLIPAADPSAFSNTEKVMKAQAVREASQMVAGYDTMKVEQTYLEALDIPDAAELYPTQPTVDPETGEETGGVELVFPPQPDPQLEIQRGELEIKALDAQASSEIAAIVAESNAALNEAKIVEIIARAELAEDSPELERLKILQKEQQSIRETLVEREKISASKQIAKSKPAANN